MTLDKQGREGLSPALYNYVQDSNVLDPALEGIIHDTAGMQNEFWQVPREQLKHMGQIATWLRAEKYVEVGSYTGLSLVGMASFLPEDGRAVGCDINFGPFEEVGRQYAQQLGVDHKLDLREGQAVDTLPQVMAEYGAGTFDIGFVDGDKPPYPQYYELVMRMLRRGGVLICDNTLGLGGHIIEKDTDDPRVRGIQEASEMIRRDESRGLVTVDMLPISDGVTFVTKR